MNQSTNIFKLDNVSKMSHDAIGQHFMIQNDKFPLVYFRNEKARFWADNTVLNGVSATEYVAQQASIYGKKYLILHPEEDKENIPFDYDGWIIRFPSFIKENFSN